MHGTQQAQVTISKHVMEHAVCMNSAVDRLLNQIEFGLMAEVSFPALVTPTNANRKETSSISEVILHAGVLRNMENKKKIERFCIAFW